MTGRKSDGGPRPHGIDPPIALVQAICKGAKHHCPAMARDLKSLRNWIATIVLTTSFLPLTLASSWSQVACKPLLSVKSVQEVRPSSTPAAPWRWQATVIANAGYCATQSGNFEIDFVRLKESSPDVQFTEQLRWRSNQFVVSMELTADEAIREFRIGFVPPCVCRDIDKLSSEPP
jgi:hypothetical protein